MGNHIQLLRLPPLVSEQLQYKTVKKRYMSTVYIRY